MQNKHRKHAAGAFQYKLFFDRTCVMPCVNCKVIHNHLLSLFILVSASLPFDLVKPSFSTVLPTRLFRKTTRPEGTPDAVVRHAQSTGQRYEIAKLHDGGTMSYKKS